MVLARSLTPVVYTTEDGGTRILMVREAGSPDRPRPRLLDRVRHALRTRHGSRRTEKAYVGWIRRYILFHDKRHPAEMGAAEVSKFLTSLAVDGNVAASTQNQALSALLFLYRHVLEQDLPWLDDVVRARRPARLPVVLTRDEVRAVLQALHGPPRLMAVLLYGAGLRLLECAQLRVKDLDFGANQIVVRAGKGGKDRVTMLPATARADLARHLELSRISTQPICGTAPVGSSCPGLWPGSIPTRDESGAGNGCSQPHEPTWTGRPATAADIISTRAFSNVP